MEGQQQLRKFLQLKALFVLEGRLHSLLLHQWGRRLSLQCIQIFFVKMRVFAQNARKNVPARNFKLFCIFWTFRGGFTFGELFPLQNCR